MNRRPRVTRGAFFVLRGLVMGNGHGASRCRAQGFGMAARVVGLESEPTSMPMPEPDMSHQSLSPTSIPC